MPMRRWATAGWYQHVNQAVATSAVTASHEDCEGAARNRNMPCPRTVGICDCELALWIVGRDHCRRPGRGVVGFALHSSLFLREGRSPLTRAELESIEISEDQSAGVPAF